jgi:hypothetical protein
MTTMTTATQTASKISGYAFVTLNHDGYRATVNAGGKTFAHERAFQSVADARALARQVSGKGRINPAHWAEIALDKRDGAV